MTKIKIHSLKDIIKIKGKYLNPIIKIKEINKIFKKVFMLFPNNLPERRCKNRIIISF